MWGYLNMVFVIQGRFTPAQRRTFIWQRGHHTSVSNNHIDLQNQSDDKIALHTTPVLASNFI